MLHTYLSEVQFASINYMSPLKALTGQAPKLTEIVVFGSACTALRELKRKTMARQGDQALIIGKADETKGYKVLYIHDLVVRTSAHVQHVQTLSKSSNQKLMRQFACANNSDDVKRATLTILHHVEPRNDTTSIASLRKKQGVTDKIRPLHTKLGLQNESDANGETERSKARMVACENEQLFGDNCDLTFAPVMDMTTGKMILALARIWSAPATLMLERRQPRLKGQQDILLRMQQYVPNAYVKARTGQV